jgi:nucleoside-diphosphate-sugar epimerase
MRVLVIGGTGFIGPAVIRRLAGRGHKVTVFHRGVTQASLPVGVEELIGDRRRLPEFAGAFRRVKPDVTIDVICTSQQQAQLSLETFRGISARVVVLSSCDVYRAYDVFRRTEIGPLEPVPLTEDSPLRRHLYPYSMNAGAAGYIDSEADKILVERVALSDPALPATVLRLPMVYGWGDAYHRFFPYIRRMEDRRPAILLDEATANWRSTWGYVDNVAAAIALAAENPDSAGQIYNVSDASRPSMADWVREIAEVAGWSGILKIARVVCPPPSFGPETNAHQHLVCDSAKIRHDLNYREVVSRREAIERTVSWERTHPLREIDAKQFDYAAEDRILQEVA